MNTSLPRIKMLRWFFGWTLYAVSFFLSYALTWILRLGLPSEKGLKYGGESMEGFLVVLYYYAPKELLIISAVAIPILYIVLHFLNHKDTLLKLSFLILLGAIFGIFASFTFGKLLPGWLLS